MKTSRIIKYRTNEIQEIIGAPPKWLVRWGVTLFFVLLCIMIVLAETVRYPDIVKTGIIILDEGSAMPVVAGRDGIVIDIMVTDNQPVLKNQPLIIIKTDEHKLIKILSPESGNILTIGLIRKSQHVDKSDELFYVNKAIPQFYGNMVIPPKMLHSLKVGQKVIIKLTNYPEEKFGIIQGTLTSIAKTPFSNGMFASMVRIDTYFNKNIQLKNGLSGQAEIICRKISLLDRIREDISKNLYK